MKNKICTAQTVLYKLSALNCEIYILFLISQNIVKLSYKKQS
jgi:hypothetical protein